MTNSLTGSMKINVQGTLVSAINIGSRNYNVNYSQAINLVNGSGLNQADLIWSNTYTITSSSNTQIDLSGSLVDAYGATINLTSVKGILVYAYPTNNNTVSVGGAASNQFSSWISAATSSVLLRQGGTFALFAPDATGYGVTASTADILQITNNSSTASAQVDVVIIGVQ